MRIRTTAKTHKGRRARNEDSALNCSNHHGAHLIVVADGMGGHLAGDRASRTAVQELEETFRHFNPVTESAADYLVDVAEHINNRLFSESKEDETAAGMGTTLVAAVITSTMITLANIGDSRAYLITERKVKQITEDHTAVGKSLRDGLITEEEAAKSPFAHAILRAVGTEAEIETDIFTLDPAQLGRGFVLTLCSDGLHGYLEMDDMHQSFRHFKSIDAAAVHLQSLAYQNGSDDNITLVAAEVGSLPRSEAGLQSLPPIEKLANPEPATAARSRNGGLIAFLIIALILLGGVGSYTAWYLLSDRVKGPESADVNLSESGDADTQQSTDGSSVETETGPPEGRLILLSGSDGEISWSFDGTRESFTENAAFTIVVLRDRSVVQTEPEIQPGTSGEADRTENNDLATGLAEEKALSQNLESVLGTAVAQAAVNRQAQSNAPDAATVDDDVQPAGDPEETGNILLSRQVPGRVVYQSEIIGWLSEAGFSGQIPCEIYIRADAWGHSLRSESLAFTFSVSAAESAGEPAPVTPPDDVSNSR